MTKALMIQGTGSGAGKTLLAAALCRIFTDMGIKVAPFKAQNMALNSYITGDGGEIGRAQALQAEAARIEPSVDMNPILLKASGESGAQVIIHGRVHATMKAMEYYSFKKEAWKAVETSYERLSRNYELLIIEGAGSPAEINLMDVDIVNMAVARHAKAPVILIGDIDRGGVFASLYGTVKLLGKESAHIKAYVINKFRGDIEILKPGLAMIERKTGKPVLGVLPYINDTGLPEEDGMVLQKISDFNFKSSSRTQTPEKIKTVVVKLKYIANFTDFDPFIHEPDVELIYSNNPADIENADILIVPGSKNTVKDLISLRERGLDRSIRRAYSKGIQIIGICGGYQMLGKKILDPDTVESRHASIRGIGLLNIETKFGASKTTCRVEAKLTGSPLFTAGVNKKFKNGQPLKGYEIHMGESRGDIGLFSIKRLLHPDASMPFHSGAPSLSRSAAPVPDGSINKNCWGTYIHGVFENDRFRRDIINSVRMKKGLPAIKTVCSYSGTKEKAIDRLARITRENIDMDFLKKVIGI